MGGTHHGVKPRTASPEQIHTDRRVDEGFEDRVSARVKYMHLRRILHDALFEHTAPGSFCVIGCDSYCPDCLQRPWCDLGLKFDWEQEDRNGIKAVPAEVLPYVPQSEEPTGDGTDKEVSSSLFFAFAAE